MADWDIRIGAMPTQNAPGYPASKTLLIPESTFNSQTVQQKRNLVQTATANLLRKMCPSSLLGTTVLRADQPEASYSVSESVECVALVSRMSSCRISPLPPSRGFNVRISNTPSRLDLAT